MKTALLSVWDKNGVIELASKLTINGWRLVASGGTARVLRDAGLAVIPVAEITGEAEMLDGRVKTLHPAIHAGVLSRRNESDRIVLAQRGWYEIDAVVVNLYPFEQVVADPGCSMATAMEHIDIGGVTLLRAGAKNHAHVTVLSDSNDYPEDIARFEDPVFRLAMAHRAFERTTRYDQAIHHYLLGVRGGIPPYKLNLYPAGELRYGENPHQEASFLSTEENDTPMGGNLLQGKPLSYNNILDLDSAWRAVMQFDEPAVVVVKHASPCGMATAQTLESALIPAVASDPISAYGSVIAANQKIDQAFVDGLGDLFVECLAAPAFSEDAIGALSQRKNLRAIVLPRENQSATCEMRSVIGGYLQQTMDVGDPIGTTSWRVVTNRAPSPKEAAVLEFAWKAVQPVRSNAVLMADGDGGCFYTVGIGGGQPNRVDCVNIAGKRAGERSVGSVLASDAFFPYPDGIEAAGNLGVTAIIQPGGSVRDSEVISSANELGLAMIFTGVRHFRH